MHPNYVNVLQGITDAKKCKQVLTSAEIFECKGISLVNFSLIFLDVQDL